MSTSSMNKPVLLQKQLRIVAFIVVLAGFALTIPPAARAVPQESGPGSHVLEQGKFTLHKFEQAIGQETYEITRDGDSLAVKVDFKFTDRGSPVPLSVSFRGAPDLTPQAFEIKGNTARSVSIDQSIRMEAGTNKVQLR